MMKLGIFAKTFHQNSLKRLLSHIRGFGFVCVQFNFSAVDLPSMPERIPQKTLENIDQAFEQNKLKIAAVSGTFNMAHPDQQVRSAGIKKMAVLAKACKDINSDIISICTGSRHLRDKWQHHPDNRSEEAWRDMRSTLSESLLLAEQSGLMLAMEPEIANVISSAKKAVRIIKELQSDHLKVIIDPANLFEVERQSKVKYLMEEAIDLLGENIVIAHAKDRNNKGQFCAAGKGIIDYPLYLRCLEQVNFHGPLILHGLDETEVPGSLNMLRNLID